MPKIHFGDLERNRSRGRGNGSYTLCGGLVRTNVLTYNKYVVTCFKTKGYGKSCRTILEERGYFPRRILKV